MGLAEFAAVVAEQEIDVEDRIAETAEAVQAEFLRLLNAPKDRIPEITEWLIIGGREAAEAETGSVDISYAIWSEVEAAQVLTFDDLAASGAVSRGMVWELSASVMIAAAAAQARITHGAVLDAAKAAVTIGNEQRRALGRVTADQLKGESYQVNLAQAQAAERRAQK